MVSVAEAYAAEDLSLRKTWEGLPFRMFHPGVPLLRFRAIKDIINNQDRASFATNTRSNFFAGGTDEEVLEARRQAANRGIKSLNDLFETHFPKEDPSLFHIDEIDEPYDPLKEFTEAREFWKESRVHMRTKYDLPDPKKALEAFKRLRNLGVGHFALLIETSPAIVNSVSSMSLVSEWMYQKLGCKNPSHSSEEDYLWETNAGVSLHGTFERPFRQRAKVLDEQGRIKYSSILTKMFVKGKFPDDIYDNSGIALTVEGEDSARRLLDYFRHNVKGTTTLEKFQHVIDYDPPFACYKFLLRVPVKSGLHESIFGESEMEGCVRLPLEVQIVKRGETDHQAYKAKQYMQAFPLLYPRQIYMPFLQPERLHFPNVTGSYPSPKERPWFVERG